VYVSDFGNGDGDDGGNGSPEAQFSGILHLNETYLLSRLSVLLSHSGKRPTILRLFPSLPRLTAPDDTSCGYYPARRRSTISFPAVIPAANREQMGKIELVTTALIIIARPALLLTTAATILLLLVLTRRYTYGTAGNSSNFSYVNFMQNFPASVAVDWPRSFSSLRSPGAK